MEGLDFFISPIGLVLLAVFFIVTSVSIRSLNVTARQQRKVHAVLMDQAKKRAYKKVTLVVELKRRAETLEDLMAHLASHAYAKLDVVVIVYHTAGSRAERMLRDYAKQYSVRVTPVRYTKGMSIEAAVKKHSKGILVLRGNSTTRFSPRFFEKLSFASVEAREAIAVRPYVLLGTSLTKALRALSTTLFQSWVGSNTQPHREHGLVDGIVIPKRYLGTERTYQVQRVLYEEFAQAVSVPRRALKPSTLFWLLSIGTVIVLVVCMTTSLDLLIYTGALMTGVWCVYAFLLVLRAKEYTAWERLQLVLLIPVLPFFLYGDGAVRLIAQSFKWRGVIATARSR